MKHTIKLSAAKGIVVAPQAGEVLIQLTMHGLPAMSERIDPHTAQALGLALVNSANEAMGPVSRGVRCHDADACKAGQVACPTPKACGIEP